MTVILRLLRRIYFVYSHLLFHCFSYLFGEILPSTCTLFVLPSSNTLKVKAKLEDANPELDFLFGNRKSNSFSRNIPTTPIDFNLRNGCFSIAVIC